MASAFEQKQSIVTRIRQILLEYPYGNAIFLELLQNADDAGANAVKVVFETFSANGDHPAASSPALVVLNSAQFTDRDLQNIQYIGGLDGTSKRHDATKVGRFGIGFNSCYHVADVVAFVSGTNLLIFDPHCDRLPLLDGRHVGGLRWDFTKCLADPETTPEQKTFLEPLLTAFEEAGLGFHRDRPFDGTIFRLPLRRRPSDLWKELHAPRDMVSLLLDLRECAQLGMTLLKNVASVSAFVRRRCHHIQASPSSDGEQSGDQNETSDTQNGPSRSLSSFCLLDLFGSSDNDGAGDDDGRTNGTMNKGDDEERNDAGGDEDKRDKDTDNGQDHASASNGLELIFSVAALIKKDADAAAAATTRGTINDWLQAYTSVVRRIMSDADMLRGENVDYMSAEWVQRWTTLRRGQMAALPMPRGLDVEVFIHTAEHPLYDALKHSIAAHEASADTVLPSWDPNSVVVNKNNNMCMNNNNNNNTRCEEEDENDDVLEKSEQRYVVRHQFGPAGGWAVTSSTTAAAAASAAVSADVWKIAEASALNNRPVDVPWSATIVNVTEAVTDGRLMCFFPIRQGTGLPVHVHGYFHLSSDRQSIKSVDQDTWNKALIAEVTPAAYAGALLAARQLCTAHHGLHFHYALFPTRDYSDRTIAHIASGAMAAILGSPLLLTAAGKEEGSDSGTWMPLNQCKLPFVVAETKDTFIRTMSDVEGPLHALLVACAVAANTPLVTCIPPRERRSFDVTNTKRALKTLADIATYCLKHNQTLSADTLLMPAQLRSLLLSIPADAARSLSQQQEHNGDNASGQLVVSLFNLCTADKPPPSVSPLAGLPLIALASGSVAWAHRLPPSLCGGTVAVSNGLSTCRWPLPTALLTARTTTTTSADIDLGGCFIVSHPQQSPCLVIADDTAYALGTALFPSLLVASPFSHKDDELMAAYHRETLRTTVQQGLGLQQVSLETVSRFLAHVAANAPRGSSYFFFGTSTTTTTTASGEDWTFSISDQPRAFSATTPTTGSGKPILPFHVPAELLFEFISKEWTTDSNNALAVMPVFPTLSFPLNSQSTVRSCVDTRSAAASGAPLMYVPHQSSQQERGRSNNNPYMSEELLDLCAELSSCGLAHIIDTTIAPEALLEKIDAIKELDGVGLVDRLSQGRIAQISNERRLALSAALARALPQLATGITLEAAAALAALPVFRTVDGRLCSIRDPRSSANPSTLILPSLSTLQKDALIGNCSPQGTDCLFPPNIQQECVATIYLRLSERAPLPGLNVLGEEYSSPAFVAFSADVLKVRVATTLEVLLLGVFVVGPPPSQEQKAASLDLWLWTVLLKSLSKTATADKAAAAADKVTRHLLGLVGNHPCLVNHCQHPEDGQPPRPLVAPNQALVIFDRTAIPLDFITLIHRHHFIHCEKNATQGGGAGPSSLPRGFQIIVVLDHFLEPKGSSSGVTLFRNGMALLGATATIQSGYVAALAALPVFRTVDGRLCSLRYPNSSQNPLTIFLPSASMLLNDASMTDNRARTQNLRSEYVAAIYQRLSERPPLQGLNVLGEEYSSPAFVAFLEFAGAVLDVRVATALEVLLMGVFVVGPPPSQQQTQVSLDLWLWTVLLKSLSGTAANNAAPDKVTRHLLDLVGKHPCLVNHCQHPDDGQPPMPLVAPSQALVIFDRTAIPLDFITLIHRHHFIHCEKNATQGGGAGPSSLPRGFQIIVVLDHFLEPKGSSSGVTLFRNGMALLGATATIQSGYVAALAALPVFRTVDGRLCSLRYPNSSQNPLTIFLPSASMLLNDASMTDNHARSTFPQNLRSEYVATIYQRLSERPPLQGLNVLGEEYSTPAFEKFSGDVLKVRVATALEVLLMGVFVVGPPPSQEQKAASLDLWLWTVLLQSLSNTAAAAAANNAAPDKVTRHLLDLVGKHPCLVNHCQHPDDGQPPLPLVAPSQALVIFDRAAVPLDFITLIHRHHFIHCEKNATQGGGAGPSSLPTGYRPIVVLDHFLEPKGSSSGVTLFRNGMKLLGATATIQSGHIAALVDTFCSGIVQQVFSGAILVSDFFFNVQSVLRLIESSSVFSDEESIARIERAAFMCAKTPAQYIGTDSRYSWTIVTPKDCRVEAQFRSCPSHHYCLPSEEAYPASFPRCAQRFQWTVPFALKELLAQNEAACRSANERTRLQLADGGARTPPPAALGKHFGDECLSAIEKLLPSVGVPSLTRLYLQEYDAAVEGRRMCSHVKAKGTAPLFFYTGNVSIPQLLSAVGGVRVSHTLGEFAAATNEIKTLYATSMSVQRLNRSETAWTLSDEGRVLFKQLFEYLFSEAVTSSIDTMRALNVTVPTADGGVNSASNVLYHHHHAPDGGKGDNYSPPLNDTSSSSDASTTLWAGIRPEIAKALGLRHAGLRVVLQQGRDHNISSRHVDPSTQSSRVENMRKQLETDYNNNSKDRDVLTTLLFEKMVHVADAIKSTAVHFYVDERHLPSNGDDETFFGRNMNQLQGPALVIVMDKRLTTQAINALIDIGCGSGGDGGSSPFADFSSVYHMTDCPTIVSGTHTIILDPTMKFLEGVDSPAAAIAFQHTRVPNLEERFHGQFAAFRRFGVDFSSDFEGTLFRFPLRTNNTSMQEPTLSKLTFDAARPKDLVSEFVSKSARTALLFLNHVMRIEASVTRLILDAQPLLCASVHNPEAVRSHRDELQRVLVPFGLAAGTNNPLRFSPASATTNDGVRCCSVTACIRLKFPKGGSKEQDVEEQCTFKVVAVACKGLSGTPAEADAKASLWATIAVPIGPTSSLPLDPCHSNGFHRIHSNSFPLCSTALPFHINAPFRNNRWKDESTLFNAAIINHVIPRVFCACAIDIGSQHVQSIPRDGPRYWTLFGSEDRYPFSDVFERNSETGILGVDEKRIQRSIHEYILANDVGVLLSSKELRPDGAETCLFKPSTVLFLPSSWMLTRVLQGVLREIMQAAGKALITDQPDEFMSVIAEKAPEQVVNPTNIGTLLRLFKPNNTNSTVAWIVHPTAINSIFPSLLTPEDSTKDVIQKCEVLLQYLVGEKEASGEWKESAAFCVEGTPLVVLQGGSLAVVDPTRPYFRIASDSGSDSTSGKRESDILAILLGDVQDLTLNVVHGHFTSRFDSLLNIHSVSNPSGLSAVVQVVSKSYRREYRFVSRGGWNGDRELPSFARQWLEVFWTHFLDVMPIWGPTTKTKFGAEIRSAALLPTLTANGHGLHSIEGIGNLCAAVDFSDTVTKAIRLAGIQILDPTFPLAARIKEYFNIPSIPVQQLLDRLHSVVQQDQTKFDEIFSCPFERDELRDYFHSFIKGLDRTSTNTDAATDLIGKFSQLPVFRRYSHEGAQNHAEVYPISKLVPYRGEIAALSAETASGSDNNNNNAKRLLCLPADIPRSIACDGLWMMKPCPILGVQEVNMESFLLHYFLPTLPLLSLDEELAVWQFAASRLSCIPDSVASMLTLRTSRCHVALMEDEEEDDTIPSFAGESADSANGTGGVATPLQIQIIRKCMTDHLVCFSGKLLQTDVHEKCPNDIDVKYAPLLHALERHYVCGDHSDRASTFFVAPLLNKCKDTPIHNVLHRLHALMYHRGLVDQPPLAMPYVSNPGILRYLKGRSPQQRSGSSKWVPEKDLLVALVDALPTLRKDDFEKEFAPMRTGVVLRDLVTVVALAVATELHARDASSSVLEKLCLVPSPALEDEEELLVLARGMRGCPSAIPPFQSPVLHGAFKLPPAHVPLLLPVASLVPYRHRWACWTQCPLLHPSMDFLERFSRLPPPAEAVVNHLETIIRRQANRGGSADDTLRNDLFERATAASYRVLAEVPAEQLQNIPNITQREIFWTCSSSVEDAETTPVTGIRPCSHASMIAVPAAIARHQAAPLQPFFTPVSEVVKVPLESGKYGSYFDAGSSTMIVINRIQAPSIPKPSAVLKVVLECVAAMKRLKKERETNNNTIIISNAKTAMYEALLRLLIATCKLFGVEIRHTVSPPTQQLGGEGDKEEKEDKKYDEEDSMDVQHEEQIDGDDNNYDEDDYFEVPAGRKLDGFGCILQSSKIPIPLWRGQGFLPLSDVCQPDHHALLTRLDARARIAGPPLDVCQGLKMASMTLRVSEVPATFDPFEISPPPAEGNAAVLTAAARACRGGGGKKGGRGGGGPVRNPALPKQQVKHRATIATPTVTAANVLADETKLGVQQQQLVHLAQQVDVLSRFIRSEVFRHALERIVNHGQQTRAHADDATTAALAAVRRDQSAQLANAGLLHIELVRNLRTTITDSRFPEELISATTAAVLQKEEGEKKNGSDKNNSLLPAQRPLDDDGGAVWSKQQIACVNLHTGALCLDPVLLLSQRLPLPTVVAGEIHRFLGGGLPEAPGMIMSLFVAVLHTTPPPHKVASQTRNKQSVVLSNPRDEWDLDVDAHLDFIGCATRQQTK